MRTTLIALPLLLACIAPAAAGDRDDVMAAYRKMAAAKTYHASMVSSVGKRQVRNELDFVAPDRYRMQTEMGTQYIIGDSMIMSMQGRSMRVPLPKNTLGQYRDPANLAKLDSTVTIAADGVDTIDGKPARKFRFSDSKHPGTRNVLWIGGNGYPLQIEVTGRGSTTTVRYSRFNDATIRIDPPK